MIRRLLAEIHRRDRLLSWTGWVHVALALVFLLAFAMDGRRVLGINPWVKPFKFATSITIYVWTIALLLGEVRDRAPRAARWISRGISVSMLVEITCIAGQSFRGVASHFNHATTWDDAVFSLMGTMILLNTLLAIVLLRLFFRLPSGPPRPLLWGIRLGLILFLAGSALGGLMVAHDGHTVGASDGGPGLPLVNWSTRAGDLRPAHALALHALQALPLFGWLVARRTALPEERKTVLVWAFAAVYLAAAGLMLGLALLGRPLLRL
jgi:hypothetical protein